MKHVSLFAGIGGFSLACDWLNIETILHCEIDKFCQRVLRHHWPDVPIVEDVKDFSGWELRENDGICYNQICKTTNNERLVWLIYQKHGRNPEQRNNYLPLRETSVQPNEHIWLDALLLSAKIAKGKCPFLQAVLELDSALKSVDMNSCEENTHQTLVRVSGCEGPTIPTGKMGEDMSATLDTKRLKLINGAGEFLPEIVTHANNADSFQVQKDNSAPTTSNRGPNSPNYDSMFQTELRYVENATKDCTRRSATDNLLLTAGVPCQPASVAGKRKGTDDDRWLWPETFRIVRELRPSRCIFENVPGLLTLEDGLVFEHLLLELEAADYEVQAFVIPACAVGAPHRRDRVWIVAHANHGRPRRTVRETLPRGQGTASPDSQLGSRDSRGDSLLREKPDAPDPTASRLEGSKPEGSVPGGRFAERGGIPDWREDWYEVAARFCRVDDGLPDWLSYKEQRAIRRAVATKGRAETERRTGLDCSKVQITRVEELKSLGNAIVPAVAYEVIKAVIQ